MIVRKLLWMVISFLQIRLVLNEKIEIILVQELIVLVMFQIMVGKDFDYPGGSNRRFPDCLDYLLKLKFLIEKIGFQQKDAEERKVLTPKFNRFATLQSCFYRNF